MSIPVQHIYTNIVFHVNCRFLHFSIHIPSSLRTQLRGFHLLPSLYFILTHQTLLNNSIHSIPTDLFLLSYCTLTAGDNLVPNNKYAPFQVLILKILIVMLCFTFYSEHLISFTSSITDIQVIYSGDPKTKTGILRGIFVCLMFCTVNWSMFTGFLPIHLFPCAKQTMLTLPIEYTQRELFIWVVVP